MGNSTVTYAGKASGTGVSKPTYSTVIGAAGKLDPGRISSMAAGIVAIVGAVILL